MATGFYRWHGTILFCLSMILYVKSERKLVIYFLVLIHFQERFQIDAFSMKTLSVLSVVWTEGKHIEMYAFLKENVLM